MTPPGGRPCRLQTRLTGAGWTYLGVAPALALAVVVDGRASFLAGLWAALGITQLVLARWNFRGLRLRLELVSPRTREGRGVPLDLLLAGPSNSLAGRRLSILLRHEGSLTGQRVAVGSPPPANGEKRLRATLVPGRFGQLFVNAAAVSSRYPFGFYEVTAEWLPPPTATIAVWPRVSRIPARGAGLHRQASSSTGGTAQPGVDVRPYQKGDPLALVCWKSTARTGRMQVRPRETHSLRARTLHVSTHRNGWAGMGQFWTMIALASALLEDGYQRGTIHALELDGKTLALDSPAAFVAAMDALSTVHPRRAAGPTPAPGRRPAIFLRPYGRHGVRALTERGAVLSHVA